MFENATQLQFQPDTLDEGLQVLRAFIAPILKKQPGLLTLALIPHRNSGKITVLSLWETQACARAVEANLEYRQQIHKLDHLIIDRVLFTRQGSRLSPPRSLEPGAN